MDKYIEQERMLLEEFSDEFHGLSEGQVIKFYKCLHSSLSSYLAAYELNRKIYLVLDNSIVQDFKHADQPHRRVRALAFAFLCRFASEWSDLNSSLGISPCALYEHGGRNPASSVPEALDRLREVASILGVCCLPLAMIGFQDGETLFTRLNDVHFDAGYLEVFAQQIEDGDWERDLRAWHGGEVLAAAWADLAVPKDMPLRYFDPLYIRDVFASRIEERIANQSKGVFGERPIRTGKVSAAFAALNTISKKGVLKGLGDIDLLQICDVGRQFHNQNDYLRLGMTFDDDLAEALTFHHRLSIGVEVIGGAPNVTQKVDEMVRFMFSDPFAEHKRRSSQIAPAVESFSEVVAQLCRTALASKQK